jgi:hypothetical protein
MDWSAAHLHLLLNHVPTVGFAIGLALFVFGLLVRSDHLRVAGLVTFVGIALAVIPIYVTGSGAQLQICGSLAPGVPCEDPGVSRVLIDMHESLAFVAYLLLVLVGGLAWLGLWQCRRLRRLPTWNAAAVLGLALVAFGVTARAAAVGGEIRHAEIRVTLEAAGPPLGERIAETINNSVGLWAANEALHLIGLTLLVAVVLVVDLKMLGRLPGLTYAALDRLLPWGMLGFGVNAVTGMLFFLALPAAYAVNPMFQWKVALLVVAGANLLAFTFDEAWGREGEPAPLYSRAIATSALTLSVAVMFLGSVLAFI